MIRSILSGMLGLISVVAVASLPIACQSGGVGDPCIPEDEYSPQFAGFKVTEENIESRSFQCQTRICLVNHFQGRVSCPAGQLEPTHCNGPGDNVSCLNLGNDFKCVEAASLSPSCTVETQESDCNGFGKRCNPQGNFCECAAITDCPQDGVTYCDAASKQCKTYVCHKEGNCQIPGAKDNTNKACCVPGTDTPVSEPVCGQCGAKSTRNADQAVYCSCRCGVAEGEADDPNFNFCDCPTGYKCEEIRKNVGLGDKQITGKYCIKESTKFVSETQTPCGEVTGYYDPQQCKGTKISLPTP